MTDMRPLVALCSAQPSWPQAFAAGVHGSDFLSSFVQTVVCFHLYYCGPNVIHHFFCDMPQIIPLSCSDPFISQLVLFLALFVGFGSFLVILCLHCSFYPENRLVQRLRQGLQDLWLPPGDSDSLLWHRPLCVHAPQFSALHQAGQGAVCGLCLPHPHVKPSDLVWGTQRSRELSREWWRKQHIYLRKSSIWAGATRKRKAEIRARRTPSVHLL